MCTLSVNNSNYGPTIMPQIMANDKGYTQVLWLYGQKEQVTEVGTMNMFIFWVNEDGMQAPLSWPAPI